MDPTDESSRVILMTLGSAAAAAASSTAKTFASHVKTIFAKPYIFGTKNILFRGNVVDDLSLNLTQVHSGDID